MMMMRMILDTGYLILDTDTDETDYDTENDDTDIATHTDDDDTDKCKKFEACLISHTCSLTFGMFLTLPDMFLT